MSKIFRISVFVILFFIPFQLLSASNFDKYFLDKTMRVDFFHTGIKDVEIISLDKVYEEPAVLTHNRQLWTGNTNSLIDTLNFGKYLAKIMDVKTNTLIYSHGFSSLFGEWITTDEAAKGIYRTFHESILVPLPKNTIQLIIAVRDQDNIFQNVFSTIIDPNSRFVNRENNRDKYNVKSIIKSGDPKKKVDLLILGDGYTASEMKTFNKDVEHFTEELFKASPFKENKNKFNVWAIEVPSLDSGIDEPRKNVWKNTAFGCSYNSFDSPRYVLTMANKEIRDVASLAPYDQLYIIVNSERYGGGGIYNLYSTCYARDNGQDSNWWPDYVFVHEFGHAFGGLGDEYYSSSVAYNEFYPLDVDPWEPNVGIVQNGHIKWEHFIEKNVPIPTPWSKTAYDSLGNELTKLNRQSTEYRRIYEERNTLFTNQKYGDKVGAFEGSGYSSNGLYRPFIDCRMFSKSLVDFCPVCRDAIQRVIDFHTN